MMHNRTAGGSRWVGDGRMASSELHDVVSTVDERSRNNTRLPHCLQAAVPLLRSPDPGANAVAGL